MPERDDLKLVQAQETSSDNEEVVELNPSDILKEASENECESAAASFLIITPDLHRNKMNEELRTADTPEYVRTLLKSGAEPNFYGGYGSTAVHEAAYCRRSKCLSVLMQNGGDVTCRTAEQRTPLHAAAISGDRACVQILLKAGADVNAIDYRLMTPLHFAAGSVRGASCVLILLTAGANVHAVDHFGRTPLHYAAAFGTEQTVWVLLNKGADVDALDCWFQTPGSLVYSKCDTPQRKLSRGSIYCSLNPEDAVNIDTTFPDRVWDDQDIPENTGEAWFQGVKVLRALACGARKPTSQLVDYLFSVDPRLLYTYSACKALQKSAEEDRHDIIGVFLKHGGTPNARESDFWTDELFQFSNDSHWLTCDRDNWPLLHLAAAAGHTKVVNALIDARASLERTWVFDHPDPFGPLEAAAQSGQFSIVKVLLLAGCVADREQLNGALRLAVTPVEWELEDKQDWEKEHLVKLARLLLEAGADPNAPDVHGHTAVIGAAENGLLQCLSMLVQWDGNISCKTIEGKTALHGAARRGHDECVSFLIDVEQHPHAAVSAKDCNGQTPLHYAAEGRVDGSWARVPWTRTGDQKTVEALLAAGAKINSVDQRGVTPLHLAAAAPASQLIVEMLLNAGANINAADEQGRTPLHYSMGAGLRLTTESLLRLGANADAKDVNGRSPQDLANLTKKKPDNILKSDIQEDGTNEKNKDDIINSWEEECCDGEDDYYDSEEGDQEMSHIEENSENEEDKINDGESVNHNEDETIIVMKVFSEQEKKLKKKPHEHIWAENENILKRWLRSDTARLKQEKVKGKKEENSKLQEGVKEKSQNSPEHNQNNKGPMEQTITEVKREKNVACSMTQIVDMENIEDKSKLESEIIEGSNLNLSEHQPAGEFSKHNVCRSDKKEMRNVYKDVIEYGKSEACRWETKQSAGQTVNRQGVKEIWNTNCSLSVKNNLKLNEQQWKEFSKSNVCQCMHACNEKKNPCICEQYIYRNLTPETCGCSMKQFVSPTVGIESFGDKWKTGGGLSVRSDLTLHKQQCTGEYTKNNMNRNEVQNPDICEENSPYDWRSETRGRDIESSGQILSGKSTEEKWNIGCATCMRNELKRNEQQTIGEFIENNENREEMKLSIYEEDIPISGKTKAYSFECSCRLGIAKGENWQSQNYPAHQVHVNIPLNHERFEERFHYEKVLEGNVHPERVLEKGFGKDNSCTFKEGRSLFTNQSSQDSWQNSCNFGARELRRSNALECRSQNRDDKRLEKCSKELLIKIEERLMTQEDGLVQRDKHSLVNKQNERNDYVECDSREENDNRSVWERSVWQECSKSQNDREIQTGLAEHRFDMLEESKDMFSVSDRLVNEERYSVFSKLHRNRVSHEGIVEWDQNEDELNEPEPRCSETNRTVMHKRSFDGREKVYIQIDNEECNNEWEKRSDSSVHSKNSGIGHNWERQRYNQLDRSVREKSVEVCDRRTRGHRDFSDYSWERSQDLEQRIKEQDDTTFESYKNSRSHWCRADEPDRPSEKRRYDFEHNNRREYREGQDSSWRKEHKFDKQYGEKRDVMYDPQYCRPPREISERDRSRSRHDTFYRSNKEKSLKEISEHENRGRFSGFEERGDNRRISNELCRSDKERDTRIRDRKDYSPKEERFSHYRRSSGRYDRPHSPYVRQNRSTERSSLRSKYDQHPPRDRSWMEPDEWDQIRRPRRDRSYDEKHKQTSEWQEYPTDYHKRTLPHTSGYHEQSPSYNKRFCS